MKSQKFYSKSFSSDQPSEQFLAVYEAMNVYPVYPRPIIMPLKKKDEVYSLEELEKSGITFDNREMVATSKKLEKKIKEYYSESNIKKMEKYRGLPKVRRFFDYEIRDELKNILHTKITNAWVKMYEILITYKFFDSKDTVNTFHLCEHPGAFIFATKHYIEKKLNKKHNFVFQSLRPGKNPKIFKPDPRLVKYHSDKLDYGDKNTGDITDPDNLRYYRKKYKNNKYQLFTSDCGLDCSKDFTIQETVLYKIFLGAFICAVGLSSQGSNYVFKLFSFNDRNTIELLQLACLFYETVDITRILTTKSASGEIYCVCSNFNYKGDMDKMFETLLKYLESIGEGSNNFIKKISKEFFDRIVNHHKLISVRRMTNYNIMIFRLNNKEYVDKYPEIMTYVKHFTNYYVKYLLSYLDLLPKEGKDKPLREFKL